MIMPDQAYDEWMKTRFDQFFTDQSRAAAYELWKGMFVNAEEKVDLTGHTIGPAVATKILEQGFGGSSLGLFKPSAKPATAKPDVKPAPDVPKKEPGSP